VPKKIFKEESRGGGRCTTVVIDEGQIARERSDWRRQRRGGQQAMSVGTTDWLCT